MEQDGIVVLAFPDEKSRMGLAFDLMSMEKQHTRYAIPAIGVPGDFLVKNSAKLKKVLKTTDVYVPGRSKLLKPTPTPFGKD